MSKWVKKPIVIEAVQFNGYNNGWFDDQPTWIVDAYDNDLLVNVGKSSKDCELRINTLEGQLTVSVGDWVIKGIKGELYPCKPDIFDAIYDAFV